MIATALLLAKKLLDFLQTHIIDANNYEHLTIDLIEARPDGDDSVTDSMVIFSNCDSLKFRVRGELANKLIGDCKNNNYNKSLKGPQTARQKRDACIGLGLSSQKKMECDSEASRTSLAGTTVSPKKTPISPMGMVSSPESDCNSNNLTFNNDMLTCGTEKMQDYHDIFHDNSEYQWFLDYGYKDSMQHYQSVFSALSTNNVSYYDDLARNFDANLAEVDMDDFHREDIHSVLSGLPNMCNSDVQGMEEREMFASVSESMMIKFGLDATSPHFTSEEENVNSMSMCKSEPLFSPVQESYVPNANLSVDSLDLSENEVDLLLTCQANKNNYTIAFEGSTVMGSDDSVCPETGHNDEETNPNVKISHNAKRSSSNINNSMVRSDSGYTTWSKIKEHSSEHLQLIRRYSTNNNPHVSQKDDTTISRSSNTTVKSLSLPNLFRQKQKQTMGMSMSGRLPFEYPVGDNQHCMKLYDIQNSNNSDSYDNSPCCNVGESQDKPHNLNLVKLFIKQKSASHDGMSNFVSERHICNSFNEITKPGVSAVIPEIPARNACFCHSDMNENTNVTSIRNAWTQKNRNTYECSVSGFEDSLVSKYFTRNEGILEKENSNSESVEQVTESSKQISESVEQISESNTMSDNSELDSTDMSSHRCHERVEKRSMCTSMNNNNSILENHKNRYYSDESTQENGSNTESAEYMIKCSKAHRLRSKVRVMEKSVQTSKLLVDGGSAGAKEAKAPAYILYPNYALPDLEFLKENHYVQNIDFTKIFLRPQTYKEPENSNQGSRSRSKAPGKRPFSVNDIETLKRTGFKHVRDWDSLTFLLPKEYKQFLQEIPEIMTQLKDMKNVKEEFKPIFCLSGPSRKNKKRPMSCDSNIFMTDCRNSNFSSTGTQPSSGYRGSSTMLNSNSSNPITSPRNPSRGFKYDSNEAVNAPPRSGLSLNLDGNDEQPHRPPLPRGILRNHSLDNTRYTCKTQKENANKRYSMIELSEKNSEGNDGRSNRRSSQDPYYLNSPCKNLKYISEARSGQEYVNNKSKCQCSNARSDESSLSFRGSNLEYDMRRLEELLEISAAFGESIESVSENDMLKLRSQVSKFLTMQKNLQRVSDRLASVHEKNSQSRSEIDNGFYKETKPMEEIKHSQTPNNTPEHKKKTNLTYDVTYESDAEASLQCDKDHEEQCLESQPNETCVKDDSLSGLKKTVSFAEKIPLTKNAEPKSRLPTALLTQHQALHKTYQGKGVKLVQAPICEESCEESPADSPKKDGKSSYSLLHKKDLIVDVKRAVEKIILRSKVNDAAMKEELSNICLYHLCPSLYAVLSDGLKEEMDTPFGPIRNSVWSVIVSSSQQGPLTESLNHLVQRLNRDPILTEGLVKFNAFIFGLLNVKSLDSWFSYLRTRDELLHKYYNSKGLLLLSNSAGAPVRVLMDQLILTIQPLADVKFNLDLMYQAKLLHCSLQNLSSLLEVTQVNDLLSPTKHLMLLKLVQSIQNSINQPCDEQRKMRNSSSADAEKLSNDCVVQESLEKSMSKKQRPASKPRPRSGCDILNSDEVSDVASCAKKRWSGVQLNSKLLKAFERLGEETETEYTDSLDNDNNPRRAQHSSEKVVKRPEHSDIDGDDYDDDDTIDEIPSAWNNVDSSENETKEQRKCILSNLNKKNCGKSEGERADIETSQLQARNGGYKFKRLQQKWEKLSGRTGSRGSSGSSSPAQGIRSPLKHIKRTASKSHTVEKTNSESNLTMISPSLRTSRIPRPVTSPIQTAPTPERQSGPAKKLTSPTVSSSSAFQQKWAPNAGLQKKPSASGRVSRVDEMSEANSAASAGRGRAVRPSSLPYRGGCATLPTRKVAQTRASSMSLNRRPDKNSQKPSRVVRTLSHRLPCDSGHLSFNEGETLRVVLEVDETWLLCCRGAQKGLVPKSCVIPVPQHGLY